MLDSDDLSYGMPWEKADGGMLNLWNGVRPLYDSPSMPVRGMGISFEGNREVQFSRGGVRDGIFGIKPEGIRE